MSHSSQQLESSQSSNGRIGELLARYLSAERDYHLDLQELLRRLSAGALTPTIQSGISELQQRRVAIVALRDELLERFRSETGRHNGSPTLTEIAAELKVAAPIDVPAETQDVRRLIIQTRIAASRLGNRLTLMHQCLEEVLTGKPAAKTTSYNREGRLQSLPSNRSLLTKRA